VNRKQITSHWDEILRLATSIKHGSVTASLMLRKLGAYPRQNGLAVALRELRIVALAARHKIPTFYGNRMWAVSSGLLSK
jgi:Tn3 transposase DDE domain